MPGRQSAAVRLVPKLVACAFVLILARPSSALDWPLSDEAIRDAYFLGTHQTGVGTAFLPEYTRVIPELKVGSWVSRVRLETPFFQVADRASKAYNYSAQDAIEEFHGKPAVLRMFLEVCYRIDAPLPDSVKITVTQKNRAIAALSDERTAFFPPSDEWTRPPDIGEKITLEVDPAKLDSSTLAIQIDTPDGQEAKVEVDLRALR